LLLTAEVDILILQSSIRQLETGILTPAIRDFVSKQKLGFVATVCPDGTPNLSPKGTTTFWDDEHLVFADIHSPGTIENLLINPSIEINIVDVFVRKGYRFKGRGEVLSEGSLFEQIISFYEAAGAKYTIKNIVLIKIERIIPLVSPVYDTDITEDKVIRRWSDYWNSIYPINSESESQ
jgi:predicted pyridoxine 5'-phosphate oxidase superfamily flavin-nucleotide-binding protein